MTKARTLELVTTYHLVTCCVCGQSFGIDGGFYEILRRDGTWFYCPVGHQQQFTDSLKEQLKKTQAALERQKENTAYYQTRMREEREAKEAVERSRAALKGSVTKLRKRLVAGICPYCPRHFSDLERHIATKHPGKALPAERDEESP